MNAIQKNKVIAEVGLLTLVTITIPFALIGSVQSQVGLPFAIGGYVLDADGNPVTNVTITITNLETGSTTTSIEPTDDLGRWVSDLGNLRPEPKHAAGDRIQIVATAHPDGDGRTNTTVILRAATPPQIINLILPPLAATPMPTPPVVPPVKLPWALIIGIIIAVVVVAVAAYYFYTKKRKA
jgi:hypothetical protein